MDSEENIQVKDGNLYLNPVKKVETIETDVPSAGNNLLAKATRTTANGAITYDITQVGTEDWNIQLKQENLSLKTGATYHVSYNVTSSVARQIKSGVMSASYDWFGGSDPENASVTSFSDGRKLKVEGPLSISQDDLTFKEGLPYALSFYASTMSDGQVQISVGGKTFTAELDGNYKQYSFKIPGDTAFTGQDVVISFSGNGPIYFDNVMLVEDSMIKNGSFNDGLTGYEVYVDSSANASSIRAGGVYSF